MGDLSLALEASEDSVGYALRLLRTSGVVRTRNHCLRALVELSRQAPATDLD